MPLWPNQGKCHDPDVFEEGNLRTIPHMAESPEPWLGRADAALYAAKAVGRDRRAE
jgi:hypothetical protein